ARAIGPGGVDAGGAKHLRGRRRAEGARRAEQVAQAVLQALVVVALDEQRAALGAHDAGVGVAGVLLQIAGQQRAVDVAEEGDDIVTALRGRQVEIQDRKSTRLNSSHVKISYAVFCLKKKRK